MQELNGSALQPLDNEVLQGVLGGDWPFFCVSIACSSTGARIVAAVQAIVNFDMPAASYSYAKCGM